MGKYEYSSRIGLIAEDMEPNRTRIWCRVCSGVSFVAVILAIVFIALYAAEVKKGTTVAPSSPTSPMTTSEAPMNTTNTDMTTPATNVTSEAPTNVTTEPTTVTPANATTELTTVVPTNATTELTTVAPTNGTTDVPTTALPTSQPTPTPKSENSTETMTSKHLEETRTTKEEYPALPTHASHSTDFPATGSTPPNPWTGLLAHNTTAQSIEAIETSPKTTTNQYPPLPTHASHATDSPVTGSTPRNPWTGLPVQSSTPKSKAADNQMMGRFRRRA